MAEFTLDVGESRIGWLAEGDEATPLLAGLLQDDGTAIILRIPWSRGTNTGHVERWFSPGTEWGDDPDRRHHCYDVPEQLWFRDPDGVATLVGARFRRATNNIPAGVGEGIAHIDYAVLGTGGGDYRTINGLRSEVSGLSEWVGQRSVQSVFDHADDGRLQSADLNLRSPAPILLTRHLNLLLRPQFTVTETGREVTAHDATLIETHVQRTRPWRDHLIAHNTVRDLLEVATWSTCDFQRQWVQRTDDPQRVLSGAAVAARWACLRTYRVRQAQPVNRRVRYLFRFDDIGTSGFRRWKGLRSTFARGINPVLATLDSRNAGLEAQLALSCIGLDGIGYQLALDAGVAVSKADRETHRRRFERVVADLSVDPPLNPVEWAQRAADASNGIKHANRDMPDLLTMVNTLRENCLVFRLWVAARLDVTPEKVRTALRADPMATPYEVA